MRRWHDRAIRLGRAIRRPKHLRTHLMALVAITAVPGFVTVLIGTEMLSDAVVQTRDAALRQAAENVFRAIDARIDEVVGGAVAAIAADAAGDPATRPANGPAAHAGLAAALAAWHAGGVLWLANPADRLVPDIIGPEVAAGHTLAAAGEAGGAIEALARRPQGSRDFRLDATPADAAAPAARRLTLTCDVALAAQSRAVLQIALPITFFSDLLRLVAIPPVSSVALAAPDGTIIDRTALGAGVRPDEALPGPSLSGGMGADMPVAKPAEQPADTTMRAMLSRGGGWSVVVSAADPAGGTRWPILLLTLFRFGWIVVALAAAAWVGAWLTRPLAALTLDASVVASTGELAPSSEPASLVIEYNELRGILVRSTAVLRRRAAAERMALNEARTGHELLASVVSATEDLIYVKNIELRLLLANRATLCVGGVDREEWQVLGRGIGELLPPEAASQEEALDRRVLAGGERNAMRLDWPDMSGATRSFMLTKSLWRDASGRIIGVVTVAHDVTEQRMSEARLAATQADLLRVSRLSAMGAMASGLAHELNQPLAAATNFLNAAGRLLGAAPVGPAEEHGGLASAAERLARAAVADAAEQMLRAGDIVRRLRAFIGRGEAALVEEDLGRVIREACQLYKADGGGMGGGGGGAPDLVVRQDGSGEIALLDRTQLQQVLLNLIRNAAEALSGMADGQIEIVCARLEDGSARVSVADNGPGLAPEVASRLFEPFVSTKRDGMGIGLAICRTIIEGHGGLLSAEPRAGGGTVFNIVLPAVRDQQDSEAANVV
jgi:two-component system sensor kinase FixL